MSDRRASLRVLFVAGGTEEPATRFRFAQFFPHFEAHGVHCTLRTAYGTLYNRVHATPVLGPAYKFASRAKRALHTIGEAGAHDVVLVQRTALPHTALPELLASRRNPRLVFDFDDAIFLGPEGDVAPRRLGAFRRAVALSAHVVAGNGYLARSAGVPEKTTVIPTVIDTDAYGPADAPRAADAPLVIGWMGTAGHFGYFSELIPSLRRLLDESPHVRFRMISNARHADLEGLPRVEQIAWSAESERRDLQSFDVGVMPLVDNPWTRGKCGFKMIQYMAVGAPVVASAVGANVDILEGSGAGTLVRHADEWYPALRRLVESAALRREMGAAARRHAVTHYSVKSVLGTYLELFRRIAGPARVVA